MLILNVIQGPGKGRRFELPSNEPQMIGRSSEALPLRDPTISRRHAELTPDDGKWFIRDLDSTNGTFVNGLPVTSRYELQVGDEVRTGSSVLLFGREEVTCHREVFVFEPTAADVSVDGEVPSSEDSMIMAVPEPREAAQFQLKVLYELTKLIGSATDQDQLLERVMDVIFAYIQADHGAILLGTSPADTPNPSVTRHRQRPKDAQPIPIAVSQTIVKYALEREVGVLSSNAMSDKRFASGESVHSLGIRSVLCAPITFKDRRFGVIYLDSNVANYTYTDDQLHLLTAIGVQTGLALANAEMYVERLQRERLAVVGETVASLSHSVKNILQGMRGGADLVELGLRKDSNKLMTSGWRIVARNLERIYELTMNMLAFSKQSKAEPEMLNLAPLLEEIVALVQKQYDGKQVALLVDLAEDLPPAPLDAAGIHQAVLNLLSNALDAAEPKVGAVTLICSYEAARQSIRIQVRDNGVGIHWENLKRLFQPFHSTKGLRGTGLGLVVTKKIVEEHGGRVMVDSTPGKGSTFTIMLPCNPTKVPASGETVGPPERGAEELN